MRQADRLVANVRAGFPAIRGVWKRLGIAGLSAIAALLGIATPAFGCETESRAIQPGQTACITLEIDGDSAILESFEGAFHGTLEVTPGRAVYTPQASFFSVGSDVIHLRLRGTRFSASVRQTVTLVATDRPSFTALRVGFEPGEDFHSLIVGPIEQFESTALAAFEGEAGLVIHAGSEAAFVSVSSETLSPIPPDHPIGDHSSETKTEIEPPWPPGGVQPMGDAWRVLNYRSSANETIEVFLVPMPAEEAYGYRVDVGGAPVAAAVPTIIGDSPHALTLRTFSPEGRDGYQLLVDDRVISQRTDSDRILWPLASIEIGVTESIPDAAIALDALVTRRGILTPSMTQILNEPFDGIESLEQWHVRSPENLDISGYDELDNDLVVTVIAPQTSPPTWIESTLDANGADGIKSGLFRFRFDPSALSLPMGDKIAVFSTRDDLGIQSRLWLVHSGNGTYTLLLSAFDDHGTMTFERTSALALEPMTLELRWRHSQGPLRSTGRLSLWHDGNWLSELRNLGDHMRRVKTIRLGAMSATSDAIAGTLRFDDVSVWDHEE